MVSVSNEGSAFEMDKFVIYTLESIFKKALTLEKLKHFLGNTTRYHVTVSFCFGSIYDIQLNPALTDPQQRNSA